MIETRRFLHFAWRALESVFHGLAAPFLLMAVAGGLYEIVTGSPSDGFLFSLMMFGLPIWMIIIVGIPLTCWHSVKAKLVCRVIVITCFCTILGIRAFNAQ